MQASLRARYVVPVDRPPIRDGVVQLAGSRIAAVGRAGRTGPVRDLGNVALLPGLINAHTHLEFSNLPRPLGQPGVPLTDWIRAVLEWRAQRRGNPAVAIAQGLRESAERGTTTLGDIVTGELDLAAWRAAQADVTCFFETMALPRTRVDQALAEVRRKLALHRGADGQHAGISPHAPYTVHPELLIRVAHLATAQRLPLAFHLAESQAELRLLRTGDGPLRELLDERAAWDEAAIPRGTRPLDYLRQLGPARRVLIIHGNYLDDEELGFLAARANRMSLVYCPRTHAFFGHCDYPLTKALALGVRVVLGTDGRASNPDLGILSELRHVARHHPTQAPATIVRMATLAGAQALGRSRWNGSITAGKHANLTAVAIPDGRVHDPYEGVLGGDGPVVATFFRGRLVAPHVDLPPRRVTY